MTKYDGEGVRLDPYVVDSTKGSSMIDPINYKGDMLTQAWIDSRIMATLCSWLDKIGFYPKSISDVARRPLEILVEDLVSRGEVKMIADSIQAREMLQHRFRVNLNRGGRGKKNVLHNQVLSTRKETDRNNPDQDVLDAAIKIYKELEAKDRHSGSNELVDIAVKAAYSNNAIVVDKNESGSGLTDWEREKRERDYQASLNDTNAQLEFIKNKIVKE
jgi:hypothetical protein